MKFNKIAISCLLFAGVINVSCGGSPNQDDKIKEKLSQSVQEKESMLTPLAGRYDGNLTSPTGIVKKVVLQLIPTIMIVQNPGRNDVTEMPTLGGNINVYYDVNDRTDIIPVAQFTYAMYDSSTGHLRLNGTIQTGTSIGNVMNTFDGEVHNYKIFGHLTNTSRGDLGFLEVEKVRPSNINE